MAKPILIASIFAAVVGAAMQPAAAQSAETINISLSDYAFAPAALELKAGTAYHLHFTNAGSKDHDFTAPEFFAAAEVAPDDQAKIRRGKVAVDKGQEVDVTVTPAAGNYKASCTHFMHSMMGMHGTIAVQ
jgi:plastocyanin